MKAVLDAGALIAIDRRERAVGAELRVLQQQAVPLRVSAAVVAQVWRDGSKQANLARVLAGVGEVVLSTADGRQIGELLSRAGSADVVDAHVALMASAADMVLTSDPGDIRELLRVRGVPARVRQV